MQDVDQQDVQEPETHTGFTPNVWKCYLLIIACDQTLRQSAVCDQTQLEYLVIECLKRQEV